MSYNGIGLQTPRGSGTNGHISRNLGSIRRREPFSVSQVTSESHDYQPRRADLGILQHEAKRRVQNELLIVRDRLEEQVPALSEAEIEARLADERIVIEANVLRNMSTVDRIQLTALKSSDQGREGVGHGDGDGDGDLPGQRNQFKASQTHEIAVAKDAEMKKMRAALGVREDYEAEHPSKRREQGDERRMDKGKQKETTGERREVYDPTLENVRNPLDRRNHRPRGRRFDDYDGSNRRASDRHYLDDRGRRRRSRSRSADRWRHERPDFRARGKGYSPPRARRARSPRRHRHRSRSRSQSVSKDSRRRRSRYSRSPSSTSRSPRRARSISRSKSPIKRREGPRSRQRRPHARRGRSFSYSSSRSRSSSSSRSGSTRRPLRGRKSSHASRGRRVSRSVSSDSRSHSRSRSNSKKRSDHARHRARRSSISSSPKRERNRRATRSVSSTSRSRSPPPSSPPRTRDRRDRRDIVQRGRSRSRSPRKRSRRSPNSTKPVSHKEVAVSSATTRESSSTVLQDESAAVPVFDRRKALGID